MTRPWTATAFLSEIRARIDETSTSNTNYSNATIITFANRVQEKISTKDPVYLSKWSIDGDGTTVKFAYPDGIWGIEDVTKNDYPVEEVPFGLRYYAPTYPIIQRFAGFSWYREPDGIGFTSAPTSGETYIVRLRAALGNLRSTAYSTGTVSVTNGSAVVAGSGTTWSSNATAYDCIVINGYYYVIKTVDSNTQITLTEDVRESTVSGLSYEIGERINLPLEYRDALVLGTRAYLWEIAEDETMAATYWQRYDNAMRDAGQRFKKKELTGGGFNRSRGRGLWP